MDKEKQRRLNRSFERLFMNIKDYEIELVKNYINAFEEQGYNVIHLMDELKLIKIERRMIKESKIGIISKINESYMLN